MQNEIIDRWSTFVDPGVKISDFITELTGISDSMVAGSPKIEEQMEDFKEFCRDCVLVAHNAQFDVGFMKAKASVWEPILILHIWIQWFLQDVCIRTCLNHKLDTLTKHLNVILENHHRAVDDAKATADIFIKMLEELEKLGKRILLNLITYLICVKQHI